MVTHRPPPAAAQGAGATIRSARLADLDAIVQLDARVFGVTRHAYFERRLTALDHDVSPSHTVGLVAEEDGVIVGFVMGTLTSGEFGFSEAAVLMDSIAVHPRRQRRGIGRQLAEALVAASGARDVYTLVNGTSWDMLKFFDAIHFSLAQAVLLHQAAGDRKGDSHE